MHFGLGLKRGRVFVDLWDVEQLVGPDPDLGSRRVALERMNAIQGDGLANDLNKGLDRIAANR
jgi:hypothetical protein